MKKLEPTVRYLIPQKGLIVRDPITKEPLPEEGGIRPWVGPEGRYWRRRANDRSVKAYTTQPSVKNSKAEKAEEKTELKRRRDN